MYKMILCGCLALAFVVVGAMKDAEACSPRPPYVEWTYPAKNAKEIPTDAVLWLYQQGGYEPKFKVTLSEAESSGAALKLKVETQTPGLVKITPEEPLSANTTYTLAYECDKLNGGDCYGEDSKGSFSFTTGSAVASQETYVGLQSLTASYIPRDPTNQRNTCEPSPAAHYMLKADGPTVSNAAFYTLTAGTRTIHSKTPTFSWRLYESNPDADKELCATITMTDLAGNQSGESKKVCVTPANTPKMGCNQLNQAPPVAPIGLCLLFFLLSAGRLRRR